MDFYIALLANFHVNVYMALLANSSCGLQGVEFSVRVSFLEMYNEELFDLLGSTDDPLRLRIYEDNAKKVGGNQPILYNWCVSFSFSRKAPVLLLCLAH